MLAGRKRANATAQAEEARREYKPLPTLERFHSSPAQIRCVVGPVGSGKSSAAAWEVCYYLPWHMHRLGFPKVRFCIVRNTYLELIDTTQKTVFDWFPWGTYLKAEKKYVLQYPDGPEVELLFRSCDRPEDAKKFKSLELTGYWIDESIEVPDAIKRMLKNRIGRFPQKSPVRWGVETTNPPDIEHPTYWQFAWHKPPPGPVSEKIPLENHAGFWQPPRENEINLRPGYYQDLREDYREQQDWIASYIDGKPGVLIRGKLVYGNFSRDHHIARDTIIWAKGPLFRGWDNSGNTPACIVGQIPSTLQVQIMAEFTTVREGIVDFTKRVVSECNLKWPGATWTDYGDPAGANKFSRREGGFTSNADLQREAAGVTVIPSEQNFTARVQSVDQALTRIGGLLIDPSCTRLINGFLGGYCYPEYQSSPGEYHTDPEKNRFSHVHDALQYALLKVLKSSTTGPLGRFTPRRQLTRLMRGGGAR